MKYSAAAREYAKNGFNNMGLWNRSEQELKLAHQYANEGVVKKGKLSILIRLAETLASQQLLVGENRSTQYHAMAMSDRIEVRKRHGRDLPLQSDLAALWFMHDVYTLMNSNGRIVTSKLVVIECFDTRLFAQSADAKVTIDIHLIFLNSEPTSSCQDKDPPILFVFLRRLQRRLLREGF